MRSSHILLAAFLAFAVPAAFAPAAAQGIQHSLLMRGHIVDITDGVITLCIGRADGATPGQVLDVARVVPTNPAPKSVPTFTRRDIGHVRIDSIVDEHFARASIVSGAPQVHDIVELRRK
ncbi:MAG: hypothetical protein DI568_15585 [Sphingomonas sp.]|nr:MAG: hypothetical protein DI568_15585 [Sphingomonas sp.]